MAGNGAIEPSEHYLLGHSDRELQRLTSQATLIEPITRELLLDAGIEPGMRVLDVGTGRGDVAFLAAELIGDTGSVVGFDRAPTGLAVARGRAEAHPVGNVSFEEGDPSEHAFDLPFDAVIGRYVLEFQLDPVAMVSRLVAHVRPGGVVAFHEIDWTGARSVPPVAIWDRCCRLAVEGLRAGGADTEIGTKLASIFAAAGLPAPTMRMTALVGAGANSRGPVHRLAGLMSMLRPSLEALGLVGADELDPEGLAEEILDEVTARGSAVVAGSEITVWSRVQKGGGSLARAQSAAR
jgi:SAM-dependent methyltransferase